MKARKLISLLVFAVVLFSFTVPGYSMDEKEMIAKVTSDNYGERAFFRLTHGIVNAGLGWTQLLWEPIKSVRQDGQNLAEGIFDGLGYSVYFTALGVWDIATFWVPGEQGKEIAVKDCVMKSFRCKKCEKPA